jgi:hypothetical protein
VTSSAYLSLKKKIKQKVTHKSKMKGVDYNAAEGAGCLIFISAAAPLSFFLI